jgi:hypothetical protein
MPDVLARKNRLRQVVVALSEINVDAEADELRKTVMKLRDEAVTVLDRNRTSTLLNLKEARAAAIITHKKRGDATVSRVEPYISKLQARGFESYEAIAKELNRMKIRPPAGEQWHKTTVRNIIKRMESARNH